MLSTIARKNKINLTDYPFKKDIANRLFLANCSLFELDLLQELLFQASKCHINDLLESLDCELSPLLDALSRFSRIGFIMQSNETIHIDKELKKYFELHSFKFTARVEPSFEHLQALMQKVPISTLPTWYSIPRSSDNIFSSIVEKYLITPKIYESYLKELSFEDPLLQQIVEDLYAHPELTLQTSEIAKRYTLSPEKLQEYIIILEFHFVLVSCIKNGKECIVPFAEWKDLLQHQRKHALKPIREADVTVEKPPVVVSSRQDQEEAMTLFRQTLDRWHTSWGKYIPALEKSVFEIERSLRSIPANSWILFDDYVRQLTAPVGSQQAISLQRAGKKWRFLLPEYSDKEEAFIEEVLFDLLHKVGITSCGSCEGEPCFIITPFGRVALGDM